MKSIFLTEMGFTGKILANHPNMRTEFSWIFALDADHAPITSFAQIKGYDWVFVIPPKGGTSLNSEGIELIKKPNRFSKLYEVPFIQTLKANNGKVAFVQEGPVNYVNDFDVIDQFNFFNQLSECDALFAHNEIDKKWYQGLYHGKPVHVMPTLLIEELIQHIAPAPEKKAIIGGSFARWYGGFQSYLIASEFECPIYVPSMHCKRENEEQVPNLHHLPYLTWIDWMKALSTFSFGVHMMPTVAAGTFSLNCAYFGIPCIGNIDVDTQRICFPELSFRAENVVDARKAAVLLKDPEVAFEFGRIAKEAYHRHFGIDTYKRKLQNLLQ
jgi:hypothetical protein